jgi:hypothetical protein
MVRSFEIRYPVVGLVRMSYPGEDIMIADTYFEPIMQAAFSRWHRDGGDSMPAIIHAWQTQTGPFSVEGGAYAFDPDDGLAPMLRAVLAGHDRPFLDTSKLITPDGSAPAAIEDVVLAMIDILAEAVTRGAHIDVEDLP